MKRAIGWLSWRIGPSILAILLCLALEFSSTPRLLAEDGYYDYYGDYSDGYGDEYSDYGAGGMYADSDSDGIPDYEEIDYYGTDPNSADTDSDGINDADEIYGFDITITVIEDDGFGGTYSYEYTEIVYPDPTEFDSDGDLLPDGWERDYGYHPTDPADGNYDSDVDGLTLGGELFVYFTEWYLPDTDGDGALDGAEVLAGTDPLVPDVGEGGQNPPPDQNAGDPGQQNDPAAEPENDPAPDPDADIPASENEDPAPEEPAASDPDSGSSEPAEGSGNAPFVGPVAWSLEARSGRVEWKPHEEAPRADDAWDAMTEYHQGEELTHDDKVWRAIVETTTGEEPGESGSWREVTATVGWQTGSSTSVGGDTGGNRYGGPGPTAEPPFFTIDPDTDPDGSVDSDPPFDWAVEEYANFEGVDSRGGANGWFSAIVRLGSFETDGKAIRTSSSAVVFGSRDDSGHAEALQVRVKLENAIGRDFEPAFIRIHRREDDGSGEDTSDMPQEGPFPRYDVVRLRVRAGQTVSERPQPPAEEDNGDNSDETDSAAADPGAMPQADPPMGDDLKPALKKGVADTIEFGHIRVTEVAFSGGENEYFELKSDDAYVHYGGTVGEGEDLERVPHWKDLNGDLDVDDVVIEGQNESQRHVGDHDFPVAFVKKNKPVMHAAIHYAGIIDELDLDQIRFRVVRAIDDKAVVDGVAPKVHGRELIFEDEEWKVSAAEKVAYFGRGDPAERAEGNHSGDSRLELKWEISFDGGTNYTAFQNTRHVVYVLNGAPETPLRQETLFELSCRNADGEEDVDKIREKIWEEFEDRKVFRNDDLKQLTYWLSGQPRAATTTGLLRDSSADGQCGAWAEFLIDAWASQGIEVSRDGKDAGKAAKVYVEPKDPHKEDIEILVKNWDFEAPRFNAPDKFNYVLFFDVKRVAGVPAQGNDMDKKDNAPRPVKNFGEHFIVEFGGQYYDPSYGMKSLKADWEDDAIAGFKKNKVLIVSGQERETPIVRKNSPGFQEVDFKTTDFSGVRLKDPYATPGLDDN